MGVECWVFESETLGLKEHKELILRGEKKLRISR
jgi:hypothetical protein